MHYAKLDFENAKEKGKATQMAKKEVEKRSSDKTPGSRQSAYWTAHNAKKLAFAAEAEVTPAMLNVEYVDNSPLLKNKGDNISPMFNKVGSFSTVNRRTPSAVALDMIEQCRAKARAEQSSRSPTGRVARMEDDDEV